MRLLISFLIFLMLVMSAFAQNETIDDSTPSDAPLDMNQTDSPPPAEQETTPPLPYEQPAPEDEPTRVYYGGSVVEAHRAALMLAFVRHLIRMDVAIEVAKDRSLDFASLRKIRDEFEKQRVSITASEDSASLLATEDLLQDLAKEFRNKAKEVGMRAYTDALRIKTGQFEEMRRNDTDHYMDEAVEARKIAILRFIDNHVEQAQAAIDASSARNVSMEDTQKALDDFVAIKPQVVSAINSRDKKQIQAAAIAVKDAWKVLRDSFIKANLGSSIQRALDHGYEIGKVAEVNIRKLSVAGVQTGGSEKRLTDFRKDLNDADASLKKGDFDAAQGSLRLAKDKLMELKTTYDADRVMSPGRNKAASPAPSRTIKRNEQ